MSEKNKSPFQRALDHVGMAGAVADEYAGGMLSSVAGLNPFTSYGRVKEAKEAALDDFRRTYPSIARDALAPSQNPVGAKSMASSGAELATLIGALGLKRLEGAGMRKADDWGGSGRLDQAQADLKAGTPIDEVWRKHGWSNNAYGNDMPWHTAIDDSKVALKDGSWGGHKTTYGQKIDHPELLAAYPEFADTPFISNVGSSIDGVRGRTTIPSGPLDRDFRNDFGSGFEKAPFGIMVESESRKAAMPTSLHETQHGVAALDRGIPQGTNHKVADVLTNTPAYQDAAKAYDDAKAAGAFPGQLSRLEDARDYHGRVGGYWANPGEQIARGEAAIYARGLPLSTPRQHSSVDIYNVRDHVPYDLDQYKPLDQK